ncbi:MAG: type III pantothenate kinase [Saprospiraceae bacterium]
MLKAALDIGNTRAKAGIFDNQVLIEKAFWVRWTLPELRDFLQKKGVQKVMISTVGVSEAEILAAFGDMAVLLTPQTPLPFENRYATPATLGKDRLAAVAGAFALYPGQDCLVIDSGTCIKYDLIDAAGAYLGGNIAPGAAMRLKAMHAFTERLPEAPMAMPEHPVGVSTETALQNGALLGAVLEMRGYYALLREQYSSLQAILTGGDADFFYKYAQIPGARVEPDLVLHGLCFLVVSG